MKRGFALALLAPLAACGLTESSDGDGPVFATGGLTPVASGGRNSGTGGQKPEGDGGAMASGGRSSGGAVSPSSGGTSQGSGGLGSGQLITGGGVGSGGASGGRAQTGGTDAGGAGNAHCDCQVELDSEGDPRDCETFGGTLGKDSVVWICYQSLPPFHVFEEAGCEGLPTGLYRTCCPPELTLADVCPG
jgi:hypothetical protein